jgi:hypothetical protein
MKRAENQELYKVVEKGATLLYDVLFCKCCNQTIKRCNFPRHKKHPKHIERVSVPTIS